jgi:hypothetical protein
MTAKSLPSNSERAAHDDLCLCVGCCKSAKTERDRYRDALEWIASDGQPWHTCEHREYAQEALDG